MGTRSITRVVDDHSGKHVLTMYRQFDGYPGGMGLDLANFLAPFTIVNGIRLDEERKIANGMGCLAAQLVAELKDAPGNIYLEAAGTHDVGEEYTYLIYKDKEDGGLRLKCVKVGWGNDPDKTLFDGTPQDFIEQVAEIEKAAYE